ncbi:DUF6082 family protein [Actinoallomurus sp. CA-142502]|uniref:DUF6082 family protein n=1 Tax=Actinoallomurus sp. CA-142502 TaxID=3239885 RepID=UPI003D8ADD5A
MKYSRVITLTSIISCLILACIAFSPAALSGTTSKMELNWSRLANVGQTYEGIGSLLTIFALTGVVASLLIQVREHRASKLQILRSYHLELIKISLTDPAYRQIWTGLPNASDETLKETAFINMVLWLWESRWDLGDMDEDSLRAALRMELFPSEASRRFWETFRSGRPLTKTASKHREKFLDIIDSEYQKSVSVGPPQIPSADRKRAEMLKKRITLASVLLGTAACLVTTKRLTATRRRRP